MHSHHHKWTHLLAQECSSYTSTIPTLNKYQTYHATPPSDPEPPMSHDYRKYARSLSRKTSSEKIATSTSMFDYLKTLSFVQCRHANCCTGQSSMLKKKKITQKPANQREYQQAPPPIGQTQYVHTFQTVVVPNSQIIRQHPPVMRAERTQSRLVSSISRPTSTPKISINYVSPLAETHVRPNNFIQRTITKNTHVLQQSKANRQMQINNEEQAQMTKGDESKKSGALSNSFRIETNNMKASDVLVYTFKQIQERDPVS